MRERKKSYKNLEKKKKTKNKERKKKKTCMQNLNAE